MWRIPPPNSSRLSKCPPFFVLWKLRTFSSAELMRCVQSRIIYSTVYACRSLQRASAAHSISSSTSSQRKQVPVWVHLQPGDGHLLPAERWASHVGRGRSTLSTSWRSTGDDSVFCRTAPAHGAGTSQFRSAQLSKFSVFTARCCA